MTELNARFMRRAVQLAARAWGRTSPNPLVGAVITDGESEISSGWHHRAGEAHAEINALQDAGDSACGATLFVSLEPCSTTGRTPPCTQAIIDAGIRRVVIGCLDPNPSHAGRGVEILRDAGIEVLVGVEQERCMALNNAFNCWIRYQRPYVMLKLGMTLDGRIATADGQSQWITGPQSRKRVQKFRQWADAILVGAETVRQDNPQLLVRQPRNWPCQPLRLVASHSGDLGDAPQVLTDGQPTRIISCRGQVEWERTLLELGAEGITALLVEGGGELAAELLEYGLVDQLTAFIAPKILGGRGSRAAIGGNNPASLADAYNLQDTKCTRSGDDFLITGYLSDVHRYS